MKPQSVAYVGRLNALHAALMTREGAHSSTEPELAKAAIVGVNSTYFTVRQFTEVEPAFSQAALRNLVFKANPRKSTKGIIPGNGMLESGALIRVGRKVLINRARFLAWIAQQGSNGQAS